MPGRCSCRFLVSFNRGAVDVFDEPQGWMQLGAFGEPAVADQKPHPPVKQQRYWPGLQSDGHFV